MPKGKGLPRTAAQRKRFLEREKITIAPSAMCLECLEYLEVGDFPPAELVFKLVVHDHVMSYLRSRLVDWALWRVKTGRPLHRHALDDSFPIEFQAVQDREHDKIAREMEISRLEQDLRRERMYLKGTTKAEAR